MAAPDVTIEISDIRAPAAAPTDTGVAFMVGLFDRGPLSPIRAGKAPLEINNLKSFERYYGGRVSYGRCHDAARAFFLEGGTRLYVSRVVGPAAVTATLNLMDDAGTPAIALVAKAQSPGAWANGATGGLSVDVDDGVTTDTFILKVYEDAVLVEQSPELADQAAAVDWSTNKSRYLTITVGASALNPVATVSASNLASGADDRASITTADVTTALARLEKTLGPGQVIAPDYTTDAVNAELLEHADATNRVALLSSTATAPSATLIAAADAVEGGLTGRRGAIFAPWAKYPGPTPGSIIDVPWTAIEAGLMAKRDRIDGPNQPAAGENGEARHATGLTLAFTDDERDDLNSTGVNIAKPVYGRYRTYGYRTLADPDNDENWLQLSNVRLIMSLAARAAEIGERFMFKQITRAGTLAHLEGDLIALCLSEYRRGALFGDSPQEAFYVDATSTSINPDEDLANGDVRAHIELKCSPFAERITIELVKVALTANLTGVNA